jgi:hypothetical protein
VLESMKRRSSGSMAAARNRRPWHVRYCIGERPSHCGRQRCPCLARTRTHRSSPLDYKLDESPARSDCDAGNSHNASDCVFITQPMPLQSKNPADFHDRARAVGSARSGGMGKSGGEAAWR